MTISIAELPPEERKRIIDADKERLLEGRAFEVEEARKRRLVEVRSAMPTNEEGILNLVERRITTTGWFSQLVSTSIELSEMAPEKLGTLASATTYAYLPHRDMLFAGSGLVDMADEGPQLMPQLAPATQQQLDRFGTLMQTATIEQG